MADQIDAIIRLRRGPDSERRNITFDAGEIVFSTDNKKTFIGDGSTQGGVVVGNHATVDASPSPYAVKGDTYFDKYNSILYVLSSEAGPDNINNYARVTPVVDGTTIVSTNGVLSIKSTFTNNFTNNYVKLSGDTMTGPLNINSTLSVFGVTYFNSSVDTTNNRIMNVSDPVADQDAINKQTLLNSITSLSANLQSIINSLSSGITTQINTVSTTVSSTIPPGVVLHFAMTTAPSGWLECNGQSLNKFVNPKYVPLFNAIGYTYGGSGQNFNLPDLRGEFIRGWSHGRSGVDTGRVFGSNQDDEFESHNHLYGNPSNYGVGFQGPGTINAGAGYATSSTGGTETRPRNVALMPCIKY